MLYFCLYLFFLFFALVGSGGRIGPTGVSDYYEYQEGSSNGRSGLAGKECVAAFAVVCKGRMRNKIEVLNTLMHTYIIHVP